MLAISAEDLAPAFRTCPGCRGIRILTCGRNCELCGGSGRGGLLGAGRLGRGVIPIEFEDHLQERRA